MKILYQDLIKNIHPKPGLDDLSEKLFQLGHEHEIDGSIFDIEFTPNRGDCLSLRGLSRDLNLFYETNIDLNIYQQDINPFEIEFVNKAKKDCPKISFLKIDVEDIPKNYNDELLSYFSNLENKRINFFTDISNYISYETGQPTHCYDAKKINDFIKLDILDTKSEFESLLNQKIDLDEGCLVFFNKKNEIINLAGIVGGKNSECGKNTKSVIVECAYFNPEAIIGKSLKYSITSDAAHKFERNTDLTSHEYVLRRFLKIVENHTKICKVELFNYSANFAEKNSISCDSKRIGKILGYEIHEDKYFECLSKLGFYVGDSFVKVPPFRHDVTSINDIAEEVARSVGYDNIKPKNINIQTSNKTRSNIEEMKLKNLLIKEGFHEVINDPFTSINKKTSIKVDNPLDSNKQFLRTDLRESLLNNLLYNERRQKDSIKLFEIADVYSNKNSPQRILGIIGSGRVGKNYIDFSKKIDDEYISKILNTKVNNLELNFHKISRQSIKSKSKNIISYVEIKIAPSLIIDCDASQIKKPSIEYNYKNISDFPSSLRDLSFSIKNHQESKPLEETLLSYQNPILKEVFIFDYYHNSKNNEIKIGFRFIFQSTNSTITDKDVDKVIRDIIHEAAQFKSVSVPGLI